MPSASSNGLRFATQILKKIQQQEIDASTLTTEQRRLCVHYMLHEESWTKVEMAEILMVSRQTIHDDIRVIDKDENIARVLINECEVVNLMIRTAGLAITRLMRKGDEANAWKVRKELVEKLQTLGYVRKVETKIALSGQVSLLEVLELDNEFGADPLSAFGGNNGHQYPHAGGNGTSQEMGDRSRVETEEG